MAFEYTERLVCLYITEPMLFPKYFFDNFIEGNERALGTEKCLKISLAAS